MYTENFKTTNSRIVFLLWCRKIGIHALKYFQSRYYIHTVYLPFLNVHFYYLLVLFINLSQYIFMYLTVNICWYENPCKQLKSIQLQIISFSCSWWFEIPVTEKWQHHMLYAHVNYAVMTLPKKGKNDSSTIHVKLLRVRESAHQFL